MPRVVVFNFNHKAELKFGVSLWSGNDIALCQKGRLTGRLYFQPKANYQNWLHLPLKPNLTEPSEAAYNGAGWPAKLLHEAGINGRPKRHRFQH